MMAFIIGLILLTFLSYTNGENCVPERKFNEFQEFVQQQFKILENENKELRGKLLNLETKLNTRENHGQELPTGEDPVVIAADAVADEKLADVKVKDFNGIKAARKGELSGEWKRQQPENVAFHAYLSGKRCYGNHETYIFDVEEVDVGNGYSVNDGIFDAPITGVYVFTLTVVPDFHTYIQAEIIINGSVKGILLADSQEIHDIHPASTTVVTHVNAGEHVYVRRGRGNCDVISDSTFARTSFSGWLLF